MGFLSSSCTFTRFRIVDEIDKDFWTSVPGRLKQFSFRDIDDVAEERSIGWTNFDDMLDVEWHVSPPEKAAYLTFALRMETRRIPAGVLKKHTLLALREEDRRNKEQGRKFIARERKIELREQVKLRLMARFLPIPAVFEVVWATDTGRIYFASNNGKMLETFIDEFTKTFDLDLEALTPYSLAALNLSEVELLKLDHLEEVNFV